MSLRSKAAHGLIKVLGLDFLKENIIAVYGEFFEAKPLGNPDNEKSRRLLSHMVNYAALEAINAILPNLLVPTFMMPQM